MKINVLCLFLGIMSSLFWSCDSYTGSEAHQAAVQQNKEMQTMVETAFEQVEQMKKMRAEIADALQNPAPVDSLALRKLLDLNNIIAKCEGKVEKQRITLEDHKRYIARHEDTALGVEKIKAQHDQIEKNYKVAKADSVMISKDWEQVTKFYNNYLKSNQ